MILTWLTNSAIFAGGMIAGILLAYLIVSAGRVKWREHRAYWKTGIDNQGMEWHSCSRCRNVSSEDLRTKLPTFCPWCGARMAGHTEPTE